MPEAVMSVDHLTVESCSILTVIAGLNHRRAFINNERDRLSLREYCTDEVYNKVMEVWGDSPLIPMPTIDEEYVEPYENYEPHELTLEEKVDLLMIDKLVRDGVISGE